VSSLALVLGAAAPAADAAVPEVTYMLPTGLTQTSVTLQAEVNPEGAETSWEIYLECQGPSEGQQYPCGAVAGGPQRHEGRIAAGAGPELVHATVTGLSPGYFYKYSILATNSSGTEGWVGSQFFACPSTGPCGGGFWKGQAYWIVEAERRNGSEAPRREAERQAQKQHEEEARRNEQLEREAHERKLREEGERAGREAAARERLAHTRCVVPRLKGDTLSRARKGLRAAHCKLGKVTRPASGGGFVVTHQGVRPGRKLPNGSAVAVTLGRASSPPR
jgi:hypothetical protein